MDKNSFMMQLIASGLYDNEADVIKNADQLIADVRNYLSAAGYDVALACLDLAIEKKRGNLRKDNKTPSILHEVTQAIYTISLIESGIYIEDPESIIALNFIHDLGEDFGLRSSQLIRHLYQADVRLGPKTTQLAYDFDLLTKKYKGEEPKYENEHAYYVAMQKSQNASLAKLIDRIHNMATQIGVKSDNKCMQYISDTMVITNDFVKQATKKFPEQQEAYESCQRIVNTTCQISRYYHSREKIGKQLPSMEELNQEMPERGFLVPLGLSPIHIPAQRTMALTNWQPENRQAYEVDMSMLLRRVARTFNIL